MGAERQRHGSEDPTQLFMKRVKPKRGSTKTWQVQVGNCSSVLFMTSCAPALQANMGSC